MRRIINHILRIVESVDVKIDLDPVFVIDLAHTLALSLDHDHEQEQEKSRTKRLRGIMLYLTFTAHASHPRELGWWNGRHVRLRGVCRKACGFKSRPEHQIFTALTILRLHYFPDSSCSRKRTSRNCFRRLKNLRIRSPSEI